MTSGRIWLWEKGDGILCEAAWSGKVMGAHVAGRNLVLRTGSRSSLPVGIKMFLIVNTPGTLNAAFAENWSPRKLKAGRC